MTDRCASPKLHGLLCTPLPRDTLYHKYGITDYATEFNDSHPFYYLDSENWLKPSDGFGDTLYDSTNGMYFIKDYFNDMYLISSWFTINQMASSLYKFHPALPYVKTPGVSPTKKPSERQIYRITDNQPVTAIQYDRDPSGTIYYYIHHDYIAEAHRKWHTESELLQLGYSFTQDYFSLVYNIGSNATSHTSIGTVQY